MAIFRVTVVDLPSGGLIAQFVAIPLGEHRPARIFQYAHHKDTFDLIFVLSASAMRRSVAPSMLDAVNARDARARRPQAVMEDLDRQDDRYPPG